MNPDAIITAALANGAITDRRTNAYHALCIIAGRDPSAAQQFASRARTPLERAEMCLAVQSPGVTLESYRAMSRKLGVKDPDQKLIEMFGV